MICLAPGPHAPSAPEHNGFPALLPAIPCQNQRAFRRCPTSARNSCPKPWPANPALVATDTSQHLDHGKPIDGPFQPFTPLFACRPVPEDGDGRQWGVVRGSLVASLIPD